jgi:hypothetical protein
MARLLPQMELDVLKKWSQTLSWTLSVNISLQKVMAWWTQPYSLEWNEGISIAMSFPGGNS